MKLGSGHDGGQRIADSFAAEELPTGEEFIHHHTERPDIGALIDGLPARFEVAAGDIQMNAVLIETLENASRNEAGRLQAKSIERIRLHLD